MATPWRLGAALLLAFALTGSAMAQNARGAASPTPTFELDASNGAVTPAVGFEVHRGETPPRFQFLTNTIFSETFAAGLVPPSGWTQFNNGLGTAEAWVPGLTATGGTPDGNAAPSAWNKFDSSPPGTNSPCGTPALCAQDNLVTPLIAIPAAGYRLRFDTRQSFSGSSFGSQYSVHVSTTSQTSGFTQIAAWTETLGPNGEVIPTVVSAVGPTSWLRFSVDLSAFAGQSIYISFRHTNDDGDDFRLDNVFVDAAPTVVPECAANFNMADGMTGVNYGTNPITTTWTESATGDAPTGFLLDYGTDPAATNIANGVQWGLQTLVNLTNTTPNTTYYYRIRPYNTIGTNTACPIRSYTTAGAIAAFPVTQDFGSGTCVLPANWANTVLPTTSTELWGFATTRTNGALADHTTGTGCFAFVNDATPNNTANNLTMPLVNTTGLTTLRLSFWLQNRRTGTTPISQTFIDVSTDGGTTYTTGVASFTTLLTAWTQQTVNLDAYINQPNLRVRFRVVEATTVNTSDVSLDDIRLFELPTTPLFGLAPGGSSANLGTAGACSATPSTSQAFSVSNDGVGTLSVSAASLLGGSSAAYSVSAPGVPASLTAGQSTVVTVTFAPTVGMTGTQTGTLQITYDTGSGSQTASVSLTGTATDANIAVGTGAGYLFRNATSACTAGSQATAPGTAYVNASAHTPITTWTVPGSPAGDDSHFALNAATLDGLITGQSIRFFGRTYESIFISSNGFITFTTGVEGGTATNTLTLPSTTGGGIVLVAGQDLDLSNTNITDNTGVLGAPNVRYGTADVDSDGDTELVITWWHAYDFVSPATPYPSASATYHTLQLIVHDGGAPNVEDRFEMRFPTGLDANNVPYSQNTAAAALGGDMLTGLSNPAGTAAVTYRNNGTGSPYTPGLTLQAETQATATGQAGWRMMGAPVSAFDVARLSDLNLVQGVTGQYPTYGAIVLTDWSGTAWTPATNVTNVLTNGQGFLWYLYNQSFDPPDTDGTSNSYALPMPLQGTGAEVQTATPFSITLHSAGDGWDLVANPYRSSLNTSGLNTWATGGTLASAVGQVWDPNAGSGSYVTTSTLGDVITAWQGMMIQNNTSGGATSLAVPPAARTTGGTFQGFTDNRRLIAFELAGTTDDTGAPVLDRAAALYFDDGAAEGWDLYDATKLQPLVNRYATLAFVGDRDGETVLKAQESRAAGSFEVPLAVSAVGTAPQLTLTWPTMANVPADWSLTLRDLATGAEIDLRAQTSYTFTMEAARAASTEGAPVLGSAEMARADSRFVLVVNGATTGTGGGASLPTAFALHTPAPNPIVGVSALVQYDLPEAATARIEVYDMLGRRVATLVDGAVEAGRHTARLDASALSSGSYVVRMTAGSFVQAQRITVTR